MQDSICPGVQKEVRETLSTIAVAAAEVVAGLSPATNSTRQNLTIAASNQEA